MGIFNCVFHTTAKYSSDNYTSDGAHWPRYGYFNRPGPRLLESLEVLAELVQPSLFSGRHQGTGWQLI